MAEIIRVTSEALQQTIRRLLPSQQGFGEDLQASNVILPIVDLTPTAEGTILREDIQTALAFGSQTNFNTSNAQPAVVNTPGFWRVFGTLNKRGQSAGGSAAYWSLSDGSTAVNIWGISQDAITTPTDYVERYDFVVFLRAGDSLIANSFVDADRFFGSVRQIADVTGNLIPPAGFSVE